MSLGLTKELAFKNCFGKFYVSIKKEKRAATGGMAGVATQKSPPLSADALPTAFGGVRQE